MITITLYIISDKIHMTRVFYNIIPQDVIKKILKTYNSHHNHIE